ncbi:D-2-hydroxyacid dehydrogenase [Nitratifractor salsuginis]|uniref:D-isomer specific 2-hydroxyacid dehydrogenase NAD-binding protein n=1 Tax=Nitratifractor salsuginis (strain DSM 16511 / JCM 12458 / E9I37-1) TaxID=749222 RepID=E6WZ62_NITSE|nr:D-2-hydroxyacid dehydrogenase [Nitratifractor salsuginis]ADV45512.1 D-isomer specific 2-hydroxyacid dehydrogenase NAD-binding protein [Nitratifractor salsuginis DSM 16511]
MNLVLLDAETLGEDLDLTPLERFGKLTVYPRTLPGETSERIRDAEVVITNKVVLDRETIVKAPRLKLICIAATGMNNVDLQAAEELGIAVKNVAGYSTPSVAQHTFAMLLYLEEQLAYYDRFVKEGSWSRGGLFTHLDRPFLEIAGKRWGIIGLGTIGREVAKIAAAFGAQVSYYATSGIPHAGDYPHQELGDLLAQSDIISIHAPLNERTRGLIGAKELSLMKDRAILLNLGRGGIVDEAALAAELNRRELYAGLDVTETEPLPEDSPLLNLSHPERLLITPHIAWASLEARERLLEGIVRNIEEFVG